MRVMYAGNAPGILSTFNGKTYNLRRNIPVEITQEIYNHIILSEGVENRYLKVLSPEPPKEDKPIVEKAVEKAKEVKEEVTEKAKEVVEKVKRHGRKKGKK